MDKIPNGVTTREMLEAMRVNCGADDLQIGVDAYKEPGPDAYEDLRNATPEELLEAEIWFLRQAARSTIEIKEAMAFLRTGFALAQPDGWVHVAPCWLRESRKLAALDG